MIVTLGWTWEYIDDAMTIPRYVALVEYWKSWPPLHQLVAAWMGYKGERKEKEASLEEFIAAARMMSGG